jgi:hypothetical protein
MTIPPGYAQLRNRMVRLYRTRAIEALHHARLARDAGDMVHMRSCLVAVRFWRRAANTWARKVLQP